MHSDTYPTQNAVVVTADFTDDYLVESKLYRIGDGAWQDYLSGAVVSENATVSFKAVDTSGNESDIVSYIVTNIDKVAPTIADITPSTTEPTDFVTVTANFDDDVELALVQYRIGTGDWNDYMTCVTVTENATVYLKAVDTAGNETTDQYAVTNIETIEIDSTPPTITNISLSTTEPAASVVVTADFADDVELAQAQYRIGGGYWIAYPEGGVIVTTNTTVFFRAVDTMWNETVKSIEVTNIVMSGPDTTPPVVSNVKADITKLTDQNVVVTADFTDNCEIAAAEYSLGDTDVWNPYPEEGVIVTENTTVHLKAIDTAANESEIVSYIVSNIDKVLPTISDITPSTTELTYSVTITATFADDVSLAESLFKIGDGAWQNYLSGGVDVGENKTVYFKAIDTAGNETVDSYEVTNIEVVEFDTTPPVVSDIKADITAPTNGNVTVTANYTDDKGIALKLYRIGKFGAWQGYTDAGVVVEENATVYFRGRDTSGNESDTVSITIDNIDKVAPTIVGITPSTTELTDSVTVTATFADDVALASRLYKIGADGLWEIYPDAGVVVTENVTVYFKAVDVAGNDFEDSFAVTNIADTTPPVVSNVKASITAPTNGNVTVTADFNDNMAVAQKLYKIGDGTWTNYVDGVSMTENGTVFFKAVDISGNESSVESYVVTNIDKVAPTIDLTPDTTAPATSVTVTANFADETGLASSQYKVGMSGDWNDYTTGVTVTENTTIYFKAIDTAGNDATAQYEVTNINTTEPDITPPTITITPSTTEPAKSVTLTAVFDDDVAVATKAYMIGSEGVWKPYTGAVTVTENVYVSFRATDTNENGTIQGYNVTNIDTSSPDTTKPTVTNIAASTTALTNNNVFLTADFNDDVAVKSKLYRIGFSGAWTDYVGGVVVTENATVYFKAIDTSDNESDVAEYAVTNIDKVAPTITNITPSTTAPAKSVTVTANFADNVGLISRRYKIGDGGWTDYVDGVTVTENTTVTFYALDTAGNDATGSYTVTNIDDSTPDTTPPTVANITASTTEPVNTDVLVTADFADDVAVASKLYRIGSGAWTDYVDGVIMTENGTVYFKAIDTSGNESNVENILVSNIDKIPPAKPTASANMTTPTNGSVNVTATFAGDSVKNEYSMDDSNWGLYPGVVKFDDNGTVYFRSTDAVGNISEVEAYAVTNIDKVAPAKPTASADITTTTSGSVTVTAVFSSDSSKKEYSLDGLVWQDYTAPIVFALNGSVYFRAFDAAGNVSAVDKYDVTNIEKAAPENKPDDGTNDYLYKKKATPDWNDANISVTNPVSGNGEINLDVAGTIDKGGRHNLFGNDGKNTDTGDVAHISVANPAKLTFSVDSTAAGTFYVYEDGFDKKGNRKLITVGKVSVKAGKTATLKDVCLTSGDSKYYVAMTAKNVKKVGTEGLYNVSVTEIKFFADADSGDNKEVKDNYLVWIGRGSESTPIILDGSPMSGSTEFKNFVGFTDGKDYAKLDLASSAYLKFNVTGNGDGKGKFTVWKQTKGTTGKFSKVTSVSLSAKKMYEATTKAQFLDTSKYTYYVSMECTDEAKGKGLYYNVQVTDDAVFFDSADDGKNNVLYDKKAKAFYVEDANHHFESTTVGTETKVKFDTDPVANTDWENFVGYQDPADCAKIKLTSDGKLSFHLEASGDATSTVYRKDQDKKGNDTLETIQTAKLAVASGASKTEKDMQISDLEAGEYYVLMKAECTKANDKGSVFYNVTATLDASVSSALEMPMAAAAYADSVQDKLFGENGNGLLASL